MAESPLASHANDLCVPDLVASHGMLGELVSVEPIQLAFLNKVWLISTTRGRFIMKRHVGYVTDARLDWTARFLTTLVGNKYPADQILRTAAGSAALKVGKSLVTVHTFLDGDRIGGGVGRLTAGQRTSAIISLAKYHAIASAQCGAEPNPPSFAVAPPGCQDTAGPDPAPLLYQEDMEFVRSYITNSCAIPRSAGSVLDSCFFALEKFFHTQLYRELPTTIIHGDYRPKNIVFTGDTVAGVFDWDFVRRAPRLVDLCGRFAQHYISAASQVGNKSPLASYLDTYARAAARAGRPVTVAERSAFPDLLRAGIIHTGAVVSAFIRTAPLMAGETQEQRKKEADRRLMLAVEHLEALNSIF